MSKPIFKVRKDSTSCWPMQFSVNIDDLTLRFNMSVDNTHRFIKLLTHNNNRGEYIKCNNIDGNEFEARWLSDDTIQLIYNVWQNKRIEGTPFILTSEEAKTLAQKAIDSSPNAGANIMGKCGKYALICSKVSCYIPSPWPIRISIQRGSYTLFADMTPVDANRFRKLLLHNDGKGNSMQFQTLQGNKNFLFEAEWLSDDTIRLSYPHKGITARETIILHSGDAKFLSGFIFSEIKNYWAVVSHDGEKVVEEKPVDPLSGARRRMNDNLGSVFG